MTIPLTWIHQGQDMTDTRMQTAGYPCPMCGCEQAHIITLFLPQIELICDECQTEYAVET